MITGVGGDLGGVRLRGKGRITYVSAGVGLGLFMLIVLDGEGARAGVGLGLFMCVVLDGEGMRVLWLGLFMAVS
jgi:hypothetical protein